ncbi:hypothetical protein NLI96_g122 [Meripilus lineatus]|uniref:Yeast cell wall synthesis Kre9/Knh1-like N-terminal domain-containing protein n=1 Tax=Meripilus lineatus TaxID=2056292 RepID=A0AAD5VD86_9APHY|nr:hypothetical protein NLI96_g122 [Physisporinus lineatus]
MRFSLAATVAALVAAATAQTTGLSVTAPSSNVWWVASSLNTLAWTCQTSPQQTFTILIGNQDPKILVSPIAIIAIQNNFDCSKTITQQQSAQAPGTGYFVQLADPFNNTNVFAQSEPFEIKPLGSAYPTQATSAGASATGSGSGSGSATGSGAQPSTTGGTDTKNAAMSNLKTTLVGFTTFAAAALGFALA